MKILYIVNNFELFNNFRAFLIEMPYKYYVKDLQAEINNDSNLFPTKKYLNNIKNNKEFTNYLNILDGYIYFWACEDLSNFKLLMDDDINIFKYKDIKSTNINFFSLFYLSNISIEMTIDNYTNNAMKDELSQKKIIFDDLIDMNASNEQWIADYYFKKYINDMELINNNDIALKKLIKENKNIIVEFFINKVDKEILLNKKMELLILIEITKKYEFESIGYIFKNNIHNKYYKKQIKTKVLYNLIYKHGKLYKKDDFINLNEKYYKLFIEKETFDLSENNQSQKVICPKCNKKLVIREGKYGKFYGCSGYPECKYTSNLS